MQQNITFLCVLAVCLGGFAISASAGDNTNLPYSSWSDDFQSYTNTTPLVNGTNGWYGSSNAIIVQTNFACTNFGDISTNAAIIPVDCTLSNRFVSTNSINVWMQMDMKVALYDGGTTPALETNRAVMFYVDSNGYFAVAHNSISATNWIELGTNITDDPVDVVSDGQWVRIHTHQDFANTNWTLFVNHVLLTNAIGFLDQSITNFTGFNLYNGNSTSYLDNVFVMITNPPDLAAHGSNWLPELAISTTNITNSVFTGRTISNSVDIWRSGGYYTLAFTNTSSTNRLTPSLSSGTSTGDTQQVYMVYSAAGQSVGTYTGTVAVTAVDTTFGFTASNAPQTVTVVMQVMDLQVAPGGLTNSVMMGNKPTNRSFNIVNGGAGSFTYTVKTNAPWIAASSNGGTLGAYATNLISVTYAATTGWSPGESNTTITIASTNGGGATQTVSVVLNVMDLQVAPGGLTNSVMLGHTPTPQTFCVSNSGVGSFTYTVKTNAPWIAASSNGGTLGAGGSNNITVTYAPTTGWSPGESNTTITIASTDGGGATQTVSIVLNVMSLQVPGGLTNNVMKGLTSSQTFDVVNLGSGLLGYTISTNTYNWVTVVPAGGVLTNAFTNTIAVTYAETLPNGVTTGMLTVASSSGGGVTQNVALTVNVMELQSTPGGLTNSVMLGHTPTPQTFTLVNNGAGSFNYAISNNAAWVTSSSNSGTLGVYATNVITLTYGSTAGWQPATSNAMVTIVSTNGGGATQTVSVLMKIMDIQPSTSALTNTVMVGFTPTDQSFTLVNPGQAPLTYTLATNAPWVTCADPAAGVLTGPGTNTIAVSYATATDWQAGVSNALITMVSTSDGGATQTVAVVMNVLAEIPTPTGVTASDGTYADKVRVTWTTVTNATGYQVWRNTADSTATAENLVATAAITYDDTTASPDVIYYYWVKSTNSLGISLFSASAAGCRTLEAPTGVIASDGTYTDKVSVAWQTIPGAAIYEVWRNATLDTSTAEKISSSNLTVAAYDDTLAAGGVRYYYWVKARGTTDCVSAFSVPDTGWRALVAAGMSASDGLRREIRVTWTATEGATSYELWRNLTADIESAVRLTNGTVQAYRDLDVSPTVIYFYWVKAICDLGITISGPDTGWCRGGKWDFGGDGRADAWYYYAASGRWYVVPTSNVVQTTVFGGPGIVAVPEDYDGDGKTDPAIYEEQSGTWMAMLSGSGYATVSATGFGVPGYQAAVGDYDGDGKADPAVYEEITGNWMVMLSGNGYAVASATGFGAPGYQPVPEDYDGDGKTDPAVYQTSSGNWFIMLSGSGYQRQYYQFGASGYAPVPAGYNGLGYAEIAVYHEASGYWFIRLGPGEYEAILLGAPSYSPVQADYDGDRYADEAVFYRDIHDSLWYLLESREGLRTISGRQSRP